jgi:hypothetical protein
LCPVTQLLLINFGTLKQEKLGCLLDEVKDDFLLVEQTRTGELVHLAEEKRGLSSVLLDDCQHLRVNLTWEESFEQWVLLNLSDCDTLGRNWVEDPSEEILQ